MSAIRVAIHGTGTGKCALTQKEEADGLTVAFEGETPTFISWKAFRQLLAFRAAQLPKADEKPRPEVKAPAAAVVVPVAAGNGNVK